MHDLGFALSDALGGQNRALEMTVLLPNASKLVRAHTQLSWCQCTSCSAEVRHA